MSADPAILPAFQLTINVLEQAGLLENPSTAPRRGTLQLWVFDRMRWASIMPDHYVDDIIKKLLVLLRLAGVETPQFDEICTEHSQTIRARSHSPAVTKFDIQAARQDVNAQSKAALLKTIKAEKHVSSKKRQRSSPDHPSQRLLSRKPLAPR